MANTEDTRPHVQRLRCTSCGSLWKMNQMVRGCPKCGHKGYFEIAFVPKEELVDEDTRSESGS